MSRKTHTENVDLAQRYLAAIVGSTDDAVVGATAGGTIIRWNAAAERLFGYKASEVKGKSIRLIVPRDRSNKLAHLLETVQKGKRVDRYETICINKNKERIHVRSHDLSHLRRGR